MNEAVERWPNRCLPLMMANEAGWVLLNPVAFTAVWEGRDEPSSLVVKFEDDVPSPGPVKSQFGHGIITWEVPYLFRTPPGYNLLARGPSNLPKDGVSALEGLVETDWAIATFTMNWKMTRTDHPVRFEVDEPFCMIVPQRRGELEAFRPIVRAIESDPGTRTSVKEWVESRHQLHVRKFLAQYSAEHKDAILAWQQHYWRGTTPEGTQAPEHQIRLELAPFESED
jgi:uncharacterized protein DUF6065